MSVRLAAIAVIDAALAAVEAERGVINDLNVYPVPDGDTGTNLALTVRAILEELQQSDAEGIPAYLESTKERNVGFYESHGFAVTGCEQIALGGPPLWLMWRTPK